MSRAPSEDVLAAAQCPPLSATHHGPRPRGGFCRQPGEDFSTPGSAVSTVPPALPLPSSSSVPSGGDNGHGAEVGDLGWRWSSRRPDRPMSCPVCGTRSEPLPLTRRKRAKPTNKGNTMPVYPPINLPVHSSPLVPNERRWKPDRYPHHIP